MELRRMRQRLKNLARTVHSQDISQHELDENTSTLIDAVLQSVLFCLSLLALVTCLTRLPHLPTPESGALSAPTVSRPAGGMVWPDPQTLMMGFSG